jgi:hypothetical protein
MNCIYLSKPSLNYGTTQIAVPWTHRGLPGEQDCRGIIRNRTQLSACGQGLLIMVTPWPFCHAVYSGDFLEESTEAVAMTDNPSPKAYLSGRSSIGH